MNPARSLYRALLGLYPRRYRNTFQEPMLQTFVDQYEELRRDRGGVGPGFWLATLADEARNLALQHALATVEPGGFRRILAAALTLPLFVVAYAGLVRIALALPHPPLSGPFVLLALGGLLAAAALVSGATSRLLLRPA